MNLWQGKRERILTLPVIAWCNKKKVLEMCVGFTCPHFGSQWTGENSWVGSPPHEEAWGCCVPDSLQGTAKSHGWAPQLNNDILGKAVRKGQKMLHSSFKTEELEKHVRNSPVNSKRREGERALEQTWVAGDDHSGSGIHRAAHWEPHTVACGDILKKPLSMKSSHHSRILAGAAGHGEEPMQEQVFCLEQVFWSLWGTHTGPVYEVCILWGGTLYWSREKVWVGERRREDPSWTDCNPALCHFQGGGEIESDGENLIMRIGKDILVLSLFLTTMSYF